MELNKFFEIANERIRIYTLKEFNMPKPWTKNPIFLDSYFCNVFRQDDKVSKWIINNLLLPYSNHHQLWASIIMCRMLSRMETLQILKEQNCLIGDYKRAYTILRGMQKEGAPIFTGAFIINSAIGGGVWLDKVTYLFSTLTYFNKLRFPKEHVTKEAMEGGVNENWKPINIHEWLSEQDSLYQVWTMFKEAPGIADFMAYQYTCDMTYSTYLEYNIDDQHWTKLGLGAVRGLNRMLKGYATKDKIPNEIRQVKNILYKWKTWVEENIEKEMKITFNLIIHNQEKEAPISNDVPDTFITFVRESVADCYKGFENLKMQDVQHWLCEYDKYCRGGSSKRKYNGRT